MNTGPALFVRAALVLGLGLGLPGCVDVSGGAVELSWSIRSFEGEPADCALGGAPDIAEVHVCWQSLDEPGAPPGEVCNRDFRDEFPCTQEHGVTGFEIAPGRTSLFVQPVCEDGLAAEVGRYEVPPPIVRDVKVGEVVTLNALLIVAAADACVRP